MRSGGGGYEVVVAADIELTGSMPACLTRFTSCVPSADHRSTPKTKKVGSISLNQNVSPYERKAIEVRGVV